MKQNKSSRSTVLLFLLGAALIVAALIMLVPDLLNYKQSNDTYDALKDTYVSEKPENTEVAEETGGDDSWWYTDVDVNLEELQQVNADIIGWIRFDNLDSSVIRFYIPGMMRSIFARIFTEIRRLPDVFLWRG